MNLRKVRTNSQTLDLEVSSALADVAVGRTRPIMSTVDGIRAALGQLSRKELQAEAKKAGIKANGKSAVLIAGDHFKLKTVTSGVVHVDMQIMQRSFEQHGVYVCE